MSDPIPDDPLASAETTSDVEKPPRRAGSRFRGFAVGTLGVLAIIGVLASTLGVWSRLTLLDSQKIGQAAAVVVQDPVVSASLATYVTEQIITVTDLSDRIDNILPSKLQPLSGAIDSGAQQLIQTTVERALQNPKVVALVEAAVVTAHEALMHLLEGGGLGKGVTVENGTVTLNLIPLIEKGLQALKQSGLLGNIHLPASLSGTAQEQLTQLSSSLKTRVPDDFGQLVIYRSDSVDHAKATLTTAQDALALFKRAVVLIVLVTIVLLAATIWMARKRRRAVLYLSLGTVGVLVIVRVAIRKLIADLPSLFTDPGARQAARNVMSNLTAGLLHISIALIVISLLVALAETVMGPSDAAAAFRARVNAESGSAGTFLTAHHGGAAVACYGIALLALTLFGLGAVGIVLFIVFVLAGVYLHTRHPAPEPADPT